MNKHPKFYKERVCINVLAGSLKNAIELYEATEGHIVLGLLSKNYPTVDKAVEDMKIYQSKVNNAISVGLGAGDPNQWRMVSEISKQLQPQHINQIFTATGFTRAQVGQEESLINSLISPTGKVGYVNIATGPQSSTSHQTEVSIETAIRMCKDMGANSIKFFPMNGLTTVDEYREVCRVAALEDFAVEPTGGIDLDNLEEIVKIALDAGVKKVIPHIYSSIIDKSTGDTRVEDVKKIYEIIRSLID